MNHAARTAVLKTFRRMTKYTISTAAPVSTQEIGYARISVSKPGAIRHTV